jgi:peroxiredoxin
MKNTMKNLLVWFCFSIFLLGCAEETVPPPSNGAAAPAFQLESLSGEQVKVPADFSGKVVAIRFWADWCPYCRKEMQALQPVYTRLQSRGLEILAVNVAQDREVVRQFITPLGVTYPVLLDFEGATARAYGVKALPVTWLLDRNGIVRGKIVGEATPELFQSQVSTLLGN